MLSKSIRIHSLAVVLTSLFVISLSHAGVSFPSSGPPFTGINALDIGGKLYDVRFHDASFDDLFGTFDTTGPDPTFWFDHTGAVAARDAITAHLNTFSIVPAQLGSDSSPDVDFSILHIPLPTSSTTTYNTATVRVISPPWVASFTNLLPPDENLSHSMLVTFSETTSVVPLPGGFCLGALGLATLSMMSRGTRRRNRDAIT